MLLSSSSDEAPDRIAFVCLGTRGDVQPLALLAAAAERAAAAGERARSAPRCRVCLITHAAHHPWLSELLPALALGDGLPSAPGGAWHGSGGGGAQVDGDSPQAREAVIASVCGALGLPHIPPGGGAAPATAAAGTVAHAAVAPAAQTTAAAAAPGPRGRVLLVFNLFALEGYHIAEALGVPAAAVHPYQIPYACPATFERRFAAAYPRLHARLRAADGDGSGSVGWGEVRHWMWPLFLERWQGWREERLDLPPVPLLQGAGDGGLPPPVPLLYGFSERVAALPGHAPASVAAAGFLLQAHARRAHGGAVPGPCWLLPGGLEAWLQGGDPAEEGGGEGAGDGREGGGGGRVPPHPPVLVDFGSMGALGLLPPAGPLLAVLVRSLELAEMRGLLVGGGWAALVAAHAALPPPARARLRLQATPLASHDLLLPRCGAVLHHGGSGTVAAALAAGTPQVVVPLQFDQTFWAGQLEYLGLVGPQLSAALLGGGSSSGGGSNSGSGRGGGEAPRGGDCLGPPDEPALEAAAAAIAARLVHAATDPGVRRRCAEMAAALQEPEECGLDTAAGMLLRQLRPGSSN